MNPIVAANLFENPLALVGLLLFAALSSWLMKRRSQEGADASPKEGESPPPPGESGRSAKPLTWQDALRQLLEGEPPPIPRVSHEPLVAADVNPLTLPSGNWTENRLSGAAGPSHDEQTTSVRRDEEPFQPMRNHEPAQHSAKAVRTAPKQPSSERAGIGSVWREPRTVRRATIASLVFAPPKGMET